MSATWRGHAVLVCFALGSSLAFGGQSAAAQVLYREAFEAGLGTTRAVEGNDSTNGWRFRVECPANQLVGHSGIGAARWGNPEDCANYGFPTTGDIDHLQAAPRIDVSFCSPGSLELSFNYYLDYQESSAKDFAAARVLVDGVATLVADNGSQHGNLVHGTGAWSPLAVTLPDGEELDYVEFIGGVSDNLANFGEGFLVDDIVVRCETVADGWTDGSFDDDGKRTLQPALGGLGAAVAVQEDDRIVVAGIQATSPSDIDMVVARFLPDGARDTSWAGTGTMSISFDGPDGGEDTARAVAIEPGGKIVVVGSVEPAGGDADFAVARVSSNGFLDSAFGTDGKRRVPFDLGGTNNEHATAVAIQADGKIVVAGSAATASDVDLALARLLGDGSLDATFGGAGRVLVDFGFSDGPVFGVALDAEGKIVVGGDLCCGDGSGVARLLPDGTLDPSFGSGGKTTFRFEAGGSFADSPADLALLDDGRILVGASASTPSGYDFGVARLTAAGALDPTFGTGGKVVVPVNAADSGEDLVVGLAVDRAGRILVAGSSVIDGEKRLGLTRLLPDGTPDPDFGGEGSTTWMAFGFDQRFERQLGDLAVQGTGRAIAVGGVRPGPEETPLIALAAVGVRDLFSDGFESGDTSRWNP